MLNKKALAGTPSTPPVYVEDVFSTYLYTGTGSSQTITNDIDLSGKGGLTWIKGRSGATGNRLTDTVRGATKSLESNFSSAETTESTGLTAFSSTGFTIGADADYNTNAATYCSWTFREQPKFFDIVTYSGNSTANRQISHNLGSTPGMVIVKRTTGDFSGWATLHRSTTLMFLNSTSGEFGDSITATRFGDDTNVIRPTSSVFTLGSEAQVNGSGESYVAYIFAHDAGGFGTSGTDNVISCGSFTTDGSSNATINLGYEPQYVMIKSSSFVNDWFVSDVMRGMSQTTYNYLRPQSAGAEGVAGVGCVIPTATGFTINSNLASPSQTYIYMAIRRPMKPPTSGTQVFSPVTRTGTGADATVSAGFAPDLVIPAGRAAGYGASFRDRLRGPTISLLSSSTAAEATYSDSVTALTNTGMVLGADSVGFVNQSGADYANWFFRRATGFMDVVCYSGSGSKNHNLGAVPELLIIKRRDATGAWQAAVPSGTAGQFFVGTSGAPIGLNTTNGNGGEPSYSWSTYADSTTFSPGGIFWNGVTGNYVAYLFATLAGVSKIGTYTGNGSSQTINCGFTAGARFVMIKRTDSTGDWVVLDTARGIVSGNDPFLELNTTAAEQTGEDIVDPDNSGFIVNETTEAINTNGASYIFLAVA